MLGNNKTKPRKSQKTEILFIERCVKFLKPGGKMAMVVLDEILNNNSLQYVRNYIFQTCQILAVISLPQKTFRHSGTGIKSSILVVRKRRKDETLSDYPIFMAITEQIGYDATGRETPEKNDLPEILKQYREFEQTQSIASSLRDKLEKGSKIFLINKGERVGRIDPHYYTIILIKLEKFLINN